MEHIVYSSILHISKDRAIINFYVKSNTTSEVAGHKKSNGKYDQ